MDSCSGTLLIIRLDTQFLYRHITLTQWISLLTSHHSQRNGRGFSKDFSSTFIFFGMLLKRFPNPLITDRPGCSPYFFWDRAGFEVVALYYSLLAFVLLFSYIFCVHLRILRDVSRKGYISAGSKGIPANSSYPKARFKFFRQTSQKATDKNIVLGNIGLRLPSTKYQDHPTKDAKVSRSTTQDVP